MKPWRIFHCLCAVVVSAASLSGCGGGATTRPALRSPEDKQQVTIKIDVPTAQTAAHRSRPAYISPATTQLLIDVEQNGAPVSGYPTTVALTPTSSGCTSTLATTSCQLTVALAPGSYTATLTAQDASSTALSTAQSIPFTVSAGQANSLSLSLSGIPARIAVLPTTQWTETTGANAVELVGVAAQQFYVEAIDADGDVIIGPGTPTYAVASSGGPAFAVTQPTSAVPNLFSLAPPSSYAGGAATVTVTASYSGTNACTQPNASCSTSLSVTMGRAIAVLGSSAIDVYPVDNPSDLLASLAYTGSNDALTVDGNGDIIADAPTGMIVHPPPYTSSFVIATGVPQTLATDGSGNPWTFNSVATQFTLPLSAASTSAMVLAGTFSNPAAAIFDASGNLYVASTTAIERYAAPLTNGEAVRASYPDFSNVVALATDLTHQDLWVADAGSGTVYACPFASPADWDASPVTKVNSAAITAPTALWADSSNDDVFIGQNSGGTGNVLEITSFTGTGSGVNVTSTTLSTGGAGVAALAGTSSPQALYAATTSSGAYANDVLQLTAAQSYGIALDFAAPGNVKKVAIIN